MTFELSEQTRRTQEHYSNSICKEPVTVEFKYSHPQETWRIYDMYVFGSELAILRLFHAMPDGKVYFSQNLNTWVYRKEIVVM